ncbi:MAG: hypothetical protein ACQEWG_08515 [Bacteroidota bacterium]
MKLEKYISFLFLIFLSTACKFQINGADKANCKTDFSVNFQKITGNEDYEMVADQALENVVVFFENYFNDTAKASINGNNVFNELINTEESLGTTGNYFSYDYSNYSEIPDIRIEYKEDCISIPIKENYKIIYVYHFEDKWEVIYSNIYPTYE